MQSSSFALSAAVAARRAVLKTSPFFQALSRNGTPVDNGLRRKLCLVEHNQSYRCFAAISRSNPMQEKRTMQVPTMGDSITEGTIVEWTAEVGQAVKADEVIALVETDKVTVDIKAEVDGVIVAHFGEIDDNIEVGADLYQIDTEAEATVSASSSVETPSPAVTEEVVAAPPPSVAVASTASQEHKRIPSIRFLGKAGWALRRSGKPAAEEAPLEPLVSLTSDDAAWDPMYGRPSFSEDEMEAIFLGGASAAPKILSPSRGAVFA